MASAVTRALLTKRIVAYPPTVFPAGLPRARAWPTERGNARGASAAFGWRRGKNRGGLCLRAASTGARGAFAAALRVPWPRCWREAYGRQPCPWCLNDAFPAHSDPELPGRLHTCWPEKRPADRGDQVDSVDLVIRPQHLADWNRSGSGVVGRSSPRPYRLLRQFKMPAKSDRQSMPLVRVSSKKACRPPRLRSFFSPTDSPGSGSLTAGPITRVRAYCASHSGRNGSVPVACSLFQAHDFAEAEAIVRGDPLIASGC